MPAVSKKQQRYFGYLLSNPDERKKRLNLINPSQRLGEVLLLSKEH